MSPSVFQLHNAQVLHGAKDLRLEQRTSYPPREGQAQVAIMATGLCGSDLHYYTHGRNGDFVLQSPLVLGHESAGIITAVGPGVTAFKVGQRVAIEPGVFCKKCRYCLDGRYNLCENMRFASSAKSYPHLDGTLQGRMNHPIECLHAIPDTCTYELAALAEPLSVVLHASRRASLQKGQSVLVLGAGAVGQLALALSRSIVGPTSRICAVDIDRAKLEFAQNNGWANEVFCPPIMERPKTDEEKLKRAKEMAAKAFDAFGMTGTDGFDVVFECSGVESCIQMAIHCARPGGKVTLVGMGTPNILLPLSAAALREVDLLGVFRYAHTWPQAISLLSSGKLKGVEKMVTQRFPIEKTKNAFECLARGKSDDGNGVVLKVMVGPAY